MPNDIVEIPVLERDLENLHGTLLAMKDYLQARDIARCYEQMIDPAYSPLTRLVEDRFNRVQGILKDHYSAQRLASLEAEAEPEESEPEPEAPEPLPPIKPAMDLQVKPVAPPMEFIDDEDADA